MQAAKQMRLSRNCLRSSSVRSSSRSSIEPIHFWQNSALARIDGMFSIGVERRGALVLVGDVGVEQRQVELDVQRLFVQLARQEHAGLGRVDVLVEVEHEVVRHDRVAGGEERDEAVDQVPLGRQQLACRSVTSSERLTSSTVHVLRIASRYMS